jgi:outer membrane protein
LFPRFLIALTALFSAAAFGQPITLGGAAAEALSRNPAMAGSMASREEAAAGLRQARARWWPRLEARDAVIRSNNPVFVFGSLLEQERFGSEHFDTTFLNDPPAITNHRFDLAARFTLFDRLERFEEIRRAGNGVNAVGFASTETGQRLRREVIDRFYGAILAGQRQAVAAEVMESAEADLQAARDRFEQGLIVESDVLASEVQLGQFRQQLIAARGEEAVARAALATLLQRPLGSPLEIEGSIPDRTYPARALEEAIVRGLENRAAVKVAALESSNAQSRVAAARGSMLPRVDLHASYGASGDSFSDRSSDHTAGVLVSLDLFDRTRPARIAAARAGAARAVSDVAAARDAVTMEIVSAWYRLESSRESALVATAAAEQAGRAAAIVRDRYQNGLTTITEQLRAQSALASARFAALAARYEYVVAYAELLRATGDLEDVEAVL